MKVWTSPGSIWYFTVEDIENIYIHLEQGGVGGTKDGEYKKNSLDTSLYNTSF